MYDPSVARWNGVDVLASSYTGWSPFNYTLNNPIRFVDPDGNAVDDPIYNLKGDKIGDDGKTDGKIHIVYDKKQAKSIKTQTDGGAKTVTLAGVNKVTINGGKQTVQGVIASVTAEEKDTSTGAGDKGLHEEGGHTKVVGKTKTVVAWTPGVKKTGTDNASIKPFNGVTKPSASELGDYWHVHTSGTIKSTDKAGNPIEAHAGPKPSPGDIKYQAGLESAGYNATAIQVDTYGTDKVNFYNGTGVITTMSYKNFKKLK